jgi:hypothetical protein
MPEIKRRQSLADLADWQESMWALGDRAEKLAAAPAARVSLDARVELAKEAFRLLWLSLSPAVVAASCKTSALMGEPLLSAVPLVEEQMMVLHRLRKAGVLSQPDEFGGEAEADQPAVVAEPEAAEWANREHAPGLGQITDAEPEPAEAAEPAEGDDYQGEAHHGGAEQQEVIASPASVAQEQEPEQPATDQWLTRPQLAELLGVSDGAVRAWVCKRWLTEGRHWVTDPSNRRRLLYDAAACREVVAQRSRKLRGLAAQTPEGAEERRLLRVQRQAARRERARHTEPVRAEAEVEAEVEPVEQGGESEPAAGGRLEGLLAALLAEIRSQG